MNLLYLSHISTLRIESDVTMLEERGYKVTVLNNHKLHFQKRLKNFPNFTNIINLYEPRFIWIVKLRLKITKLIKFLLTLTKLDTSRKVISFREKVSLESISRVSNSTKKTITRIIKEKEIDVIYCSWSTTGFPEIKVIQEANLGIPIILSIQTYPFWQTAVVGGSFKENKEHKEIFENLDGRIHCSQVMFDYMNDHFNLTKHGKDLIMMGYCKKRNFYKKRLPLLSEKEGESHIVFIGNTQFSQRTLDDVGRQLYCIAKKRIHIHFSYTHDRIKRNPYIHMFSPFSHRQLLNGELATHMTQFDACIVLYNIDKPYARFNNSLPERFLFALNGAVPIALPKGYFAACEEMINKYQIGFTYENLDDLKIKLSDREKMAEYRNNAVYIAPSLTFEKNFYILDNFIKKVISAAKPKNDKKA